MFDRIKKAFARDAKPAAHAPAAVPQTRHGSVSEWAATQGMTFMGMASGQGFGLQGQVGGKPWKMELGKPGRKYIVGQELRGRSELGVDPDVLVVVMNRPLKEALEKQAYALFTDTLQTSADPNLPEEMRLLSMYDEVGWESLPRAFWSRYSVVAGSREHAMAWVDPLLAKQLLEWPAPAPPNEQPFMLLLLRGKAYLRMEQKVEHMPTLQHAATVFTSACENALGAFKAP